MTLTRNARFLMLGGLALLMLATRFDHFLEVPDASWAVFFIAGFYLRGMARWAFPLLMLEAVAIDAFAVTQAGVSAFCIAPASYAFLVPTHAVMWIGGHWLRERPHADLRGLPALAGAALLATTAAYALSNGGFYWFSGRDADPNLARYLERFAAYYAHFLVVPCAYIAAAAFVHVGVALGLRASGARTSA